MTRTAKVGTAFALFAAAVSFLIISCRFLAEKHSPGVLPEHRGQLRCWPRQFGDRNHPVRCGHRGDVVGDRAPRRPDRRDPGAGDRHRPERRRAASQCHDQRVVDVRSLLRRGRRRRGHDALLRAAGVLAGQLFQGRNSGLFYALRPTARRWDSWCWSPCGRTWTTPCPGTRCCSPSVWSSSSCCCRCPWRWSACPPVGSRPGWRRGSRCGARRPRRSVIRRSAPGAGLHRLWKHDGLH